MKLNEIKLIESNHSKLLKQWIGSGEAFRDDPDADDEELQSAIDAMEYRIKEFAQAKNYLKFTLDKFDYEIQDVKVSRLGHIQDEVETDNGSLTYMAKEHKKTYYKQLTRKHDVMPILLNSDWQIMDGYHRTASAKLNSNDTVPALVPVKPGTGRVLNAESYIES